MIFSARMRLWNAIAVPFLKAQWVPSPMSWGTLTPPALAVVDGKMINVDAWNRLRGVEIDRARRKLWRVAVGPIVCNSENLAKNAGAEIFAMRKGMMKLRKVKRDRGNALREEMARARQARHRGWGMVKKSYRDRMALNARERAHRHLRPGRASEQHVRPVRVLPFPYWL